MKALAAAASALALAALGGSAQAAFHSSVTRIPPRVRERMVGSSWHSGCPVPLRKLRLVRVTIHRFDGTNSHGRKIIHWRAGQGRAPGVDQAQPAHYSI